MYEKGKQKQVADEASDDILSKSDEESGSVATTSRVDTTAQDLGKAQIDAAFKRLAARLKSENALVIMPTFYPQEGSILQELAESEVDTHIYGPGNGVFKNVPHTKVDGVASNVDSETTENIQKIINAIDLEHLRGKKIYIYQFMHYEWKELLEARIKDYNEKNPDKPLNCTIMADMTMGHEPFFEGKHRLPGILKEAKLLEHQIPGTISNLTELRDQPLSESQIREFFKIQQQSEQTGKIVVQFCGEGYKEVGGGQGTIIFDSYAEFQQALRLFKTLNEAEESALVKDGKVEKFLKIARANVSCEGVSLKVSKYIEGIEGNLSFVVLPSYTRGETNVDIREKQFEPSKTQIKKQMQGLDCRGTVVVPGRMTLKCVGDSRLTTKSGSGVGNDLGFYYGDIVDDQITQISMQLGQHMATCGHRGLAGCDIKITPDGKIYIIEINDRQQGPTAGMSQDAEEKGAPSLIKMQLIYAFGTLEEIAEAQVAVRGKEQEIAETYMSSGGSFYIKFANTNRNAASRIALNPGYYCLIRGADNEWHWDLEHPIPEDEAKSSIQNNDLETGKVVLGLKGCSFKSGKSFELDEQMAKIIGSSSKQFPSPFSVNESKTKVVLQDGFWLQVISDLRNQIEHGYIRVAPSTTHTSQDFGEAKAQTAPKSAILAQPCAQDVVMVGQNVAVRAGFFVKQAVARGTTQALQPGLV